MGLDQAAGWTTNHEPLTEDNKVVQISTENDEVTKFQNFKITINRCAINSEIGE